MVTIIKNSRLLPWPSESSFSLSIPRVTKADVIFFFSLSIPRVTKSDVIFSKWGPLFLGDRFRGVLKTTSPAQETWGWLSDGFRLWSLLNLFHFILAPNLHSPTSLSCVFHSRKVQFVMGASAGLSSSKPSCIHPACIEESPECFEKSCRQASYIRMLEERA